MSETESVWKVARSLKPPVREATFPGSFFVLKHKATGLYYLRGHGFVADSLPLASVVGVTRASMLVACSPDGTVEVVPVAGKPMLS